MAVQEGLRPFKIFKNRAKELPYSFVNLWEKFFSICQIKTGLSIIARL